MALQTLNSTNGDKLLKLKKSDFEAPQEVRWCPGCGDYSVLATVQRFLASLGEPPEKHVFVSGIGCSARFPYYMNTYGFHTIHGRAPAVAIGLKLAQPELSVWVITGDGDSLSIGGNHFIHMLRRNLDINVLLFNNQIYGLTKGQYSPTSERGKVTKSSPVGSPDTPLNPISLALGAQSSFVARTLDVDAKHMLQILSDAREHKGTSLVEIYQNCNIFNDGAYDHVRGRAEREAFALLLEHNKPLVFGKDKNKGLRIDRDTAEVIEFDPNVPDAAQKAGVTVFDINSPAIAHALANIQTSEELPVPMGVFYKTKRPNLGETLQDQCKEALKKSPLPGPPMKNLKELFHSGDTWTVK